MQTSYFRNLSKIRFFLGPFVCQDDRSGRWYLTGVVSWGFECARPGKYGVYAKVSTMFDWVQDKIVRD